MHQHSRIITHHLRQYQSCIHQLRTGKGAANHAVNPESVWIAIRIRAAEIINPKHRILFKPQKTQTDCHTVRTHTRTHKTKQRFTLIRSHIFGEIPRP